MSAELPTSLLEWQSLRQICLWLNFGKHRVSILGQSALGLLLARLTLVNRVSIKSTIFIARYANKDAIVATIRATPPFDCLLWHGLQRPHFSLSLVILNIIITLLHYFRLLAASTSIRIFEQL